MKSVPKLALLVLIGLALGACAPASGGGEALLDQEWTLRSMTIGGTEFELEREVATTIQFSADGRYGGHGGCNSYSGAFRHQGSRISLEPAAATLMGCLVGGDQETAFFSALPQLTLFAIGPEGLRLSSSDGSTSLTFVASSAR
jgi:putative lipoprotein